MHPRDQHRHPARLSHRPSRLHHRAHRAAQPRRTGRLPLARHRGAARRGRGAQPRLPPPRRDDTGTLVGRARPDRGRRRRGSAGHVRLRRGPVHGEGGPGRPTGLAGGRLDRDRLVRQRPPARLHLRHGHPRLGLLRPVRGLPGDKLWLHLQTEAGGEQPSWQAWLWWGDRWNLLTSRPLPLSGQAEIEQYVEVHADPADPGTVTIPRLAIDNVQLKTSPDAGLRPWNAEVPTSPGADFATYCLDWRVPYTSWTTTTC
ncbi:hypothetical protein ACFQZ4_26615 [Catellatospora coxensis]